MGWVNRWVGWVNRLRTQRVPVGYYDGRPMPPLTADMRQKWRQFLLSREGQAGLRHLEVGRPPLLVNVSPTQADQRYHLLAGWEMMHRGLLSLMTPEAGTRELPETFTIENESNLS